MSNTLSGSHEVFVECDCINALSVSLEIQPKTTNAQMVHLFQFGICDGLHIYDCDSTSLIAQCLEGSQGA